MCFLVTVGDQEQCSQFKYDFLKHLLNSKTYFLTMEIKIEQNVIGNVPASRSTLSIKSIVKDFEKSLKDLQDLDKDLISKSVLEAMKEQLKKLEKENASLKTDLESTRKLKDENACLKANLKNQLISMQKLRNENEELKAEFEATERDKIVYYNQYHQNGKEVRELKTEVERLKNQNQALKDANEYSKESGPLPALTENVKDLQHDRSSSSIASAVPIDDSESDVDEVINNIQPELALSENDVGTESQPDAKRPRLELPGTESEVENKWKCMLCKTLRFKTIEDVRFHIKTLHPERKHFCDKCPYATNHLTNIRKHLNQHQTNEMKYKDSASAIFCSLCNVTFGSMKMLTLHRNYYH